MPIDIDPKFISGSMATDQELANAIAIMASQMGFAREHKDPFGRLISVTPTVLESFDHKNSKHPDDFDEVITGSATSVLNANTVALDMTCGTGATDSVIRQTYRQFEYTRGNGQLFLFSMNPGGTFKTNNKRLWGAGDTNNGAFFCIDGNSFGVCIRSKISGSVVDTEIYQDNFNLDKCNGLGPSGVTFDPSKQNLFFIQYSWLGTNVVQFGILVDGKQIFMHQYNTANINENAWCQSGSLPIRLENSNTGITASSTTLKINCMSVFSIGASERLREFTTISTQITPFSLTTTETVFAGIRLRSDKRYIGAVPHSYQLLPNAGNGVAYYKVIIRPTLVGATWANISEYCEGLTNNPTYTGGFVIDEGYVNLTTTGRLTTTFVPNLENHLGYSINGIPDALIITIRTNAGTGQVFFSGTIAEII